MREIKFRSWDKDDEVMRSWEELILEKDKGDDFYLLGYEENQVVTSYDHEQILMQYTGLKDKNGVEIYEGDIIEFFHENNTADTAERSEIVYYGDRGYPAFDFNGLRIKEHHFMEVNALSEIAQSGNYYYKVIGNIYDNPELLEVKT